MRYLCLIYDDEKTMGDDVEERIGCLHGRVLRLHRRTSGRAATTWPARRCSPVSTATTVRVRNGKVSTTDGPVRRDQGAAGRLLPHRSQGPERRHPGGLARSRRPASGSVEVRPSWTSSSRSVPRHRWARTAQRLARRSTPSTAPSRAASSPRSIRLLGDFDLAEEALHDAFAAALEQWPRDGVPANPRAWLVSTGRFKAIDAIRRRARFDASLAELAEQLEAAAERAARAERRATESRTIGCG